MSFYVYGLRLKGDLECRYVGQTGKATPELRLREIISDAKQRIKENYRIHPDCFAVWVVENADNIEIFKIAKCTYRPEARATERTIIALVLRLGHRLLNVEGVPVEDRIGFVPSSEPAYGQSEAA